MKEAIGVLIGILIVMVALGAVWWAVQQLMPLIPLAEPFHTIVRVLLTLILVFVVLWLILVLLGLVGVRVPNPFSDIGGRAFAALPAAPAGHLRGVLNG